MGSEMCIRDRDNEGQPAVRDPAITEAVPENIDLYGVDWDGPLPVERLNIVDVDPPNCPIPQDTLDLFQQSRSLMCMGLIFTCKLSLFCKM